jgi:hypothetical protein
MYCFPDWDKHDSAVGIWKQKLTLEIEYKEKTTKSIVVEERPGYKVNAKAASKKKTKQVE